jgi:hypothetical protein
MLNLTRVLRLTDWRPEPGDEKQWASHVAQIEAASARQQERHAAERFARALELLGDEKPEVRWGGLFALERLARCSPRDQSEVSEVLATYVRRHAPWQPGEPPTRIASEVQLIVTILARRKYSFESEDRPLDLHSTNLGKAHLPFARLQGAFLYNCNLEGALLFRAQLRGAWLARAHLRNVNLDGAHIEGADLSDVTGLNEEQLQFTFWDAKTTLPGYLSLDRLMAVRRAAGDKFAAEN